MTTMRMTVFGAVLGTLCRAAAAWAGSAPETLPPPTDFRQISLPAQPGANPGTALWEMLDGQRIVRNVTAPAIVPFLPVAAAPMAACVVIPGGAFLFNSFDHEGTMVARRLNAAGIAAFVLNYRLVPTPVQRATFLSVARQVFAQAEHAESIGVRYIPPGVDAAADDARSAIAYVRQHAGEFHVDPARVGIVGFSAGGITAMAVATRHTPQTRPDFVAEIYGAMPYPAVPPDAPPLFAAAATDDPLLGTASLPIFQAWRAAGRPAELHIYQSGGHGFGMVPKGTSSDHWADELIWWLRAQAIIGR